MKYLWWLLNRYMHISKMENEYVVNNMVIYIEKKIVEKFNYDWIIWLVQEYEKTMDNPSDIYSFFYSYSYTKFSIHFYWISDNNVKYINFKYIILAPLTILVKIHHCLAWYIMHDLWIM